MAILTTVFSLLTIQIFILVSNSKADPQIKVHLSEISPDVTSSLDINCSFSFVDHPEMAAFESLILSRANSSSQEFQDLAEITQFSPDSVTVLTQEKVTATGAHSQTGESFIEVTWEFPTDTQAGVYQCAAHGLDTLGQPLEVVNISTVTVDGANLTYLFEKLKQMEIRETDMEKQISEMGSTMASMEKHIQALELSNSRLCPCDGNLEPNVTLELLNYLGTYQNHDYYFSKEGFGHINNAMDVCESYGGYLMEIDNEGEFDAIKAFLDPTIGFYFVVIAGTDKALDGTWLFQSNNKPLPFQSWIYSGANIGTDENCLGMDRRHSWDMDDWHCDYEPPDKYFRFTCEIPRV